MCCFLICWYLHRFTRNLQYMNAKLFLLLILNNFKLATPRNNNKNNFPFAAIFLQICVNFQKYWSTVMSNDGLIRENIDLLHIHWAVITCRVCNEEPKVDSSINCWSLFKSSRAWSHFCIKISEASLPRKENEEKILAFSKLLKI